MLFEEVLAIRFLLKKTNLSKIKIRKGIAACLGRLGKISKKEGDLNKAFLLFDESHEIMRDIAKLEPESENIRDLSVALIRLAQIHKKQENHDLAIGRLNEALKIRRALVSENPHRVEFKKGLSFVLHVAGAFHKKIGKTRDALFFSQEALQIRRLLLKEESHRADLKRDISSSLRQLGDLFLETGDIRSAREFFKESLHLKRTLVTQNPDPNLPNQIAALERVLARLTSIPSALPSEAGGETDSVSPRHI
jgi:tetratricopeptide (TPR) repeat protein